MCSIQICLGELEQQRNLVPGASTKQISPQIPTPPTCPPSPKPTEVLDGAAVAPDVQPKALQQREHGLTRTYHCLHLPGAASRWAGRRWLSGHPPAPGGLARGWRWARAPAGAQGRRRRLQGTAGWRLAGQAGVVPMGSRAGAAAAPSPPAVAPWLGWCCGAGMERGEMR